MKKDENQLGRVWVLMLFTMLFCLGAYFLPERIAGHALKRLDLLSDFSDTRSTIELMDSLRRQLTMEMDSVEVDSVAMEHEQASMIEIDSTALVLRDSLYRAMYAIEGADSLGSRIEDYSTGHIGLSRFFAALTQEVTQRPVRIAVLGDSFIEGDIMVGDLRSSLQRQYGGRGVGFVPVQSVAAQYRPTVEEEAEGWQAYSILDDYQQDYALSGMLFKAESVEATIHAKMNDRYPGLEEASTLKVIYAQNQQTIMYLSTNTLQDTLTLPLPPTEQITQMELQGVFNEVNIRFTQADGFQALGIAMEDSVGVVVDNYSLRGHSGLSLERLDSASCAAFRQIRPYDLIILQYGLNVANDSVMNYDWYAQRMLKAIAQVKRCFPEADLLMMSVSDRSRKGEQGFETMPAVLALLHAQRKLAKRAGIPFWNLFGAMGGENSMVRYVENNWASKDYTHLGFRGGREVAKALLEALEAEKEFYEEMEKRME
ncbi:MAG: hypothetical protein ACI3ZY_07915 [Parabacteroides sp.]